MKNLITLVTLLICMISVKAQIAPGGVNTNILFWIKADAGVTTTGTNVTAWADQSTAATAITVNGSPDEVAVGRNYNPIVDMTFSNGVDGGDWLSTADVNVQSFFTVAQLTDVTRAATHLVTYDDVTTSQPCGGCPLHGGTSAGTAAYGNPVYGNGDFQAAGVWRTNGDPTGVTSLTAHSGNFDIITALGDGTSDANVFLGGQASETWFDGRKRDWFGPVGEMVVYTGAITTIEANKIESYLAIKYGITLGGNGSTTLAYTSSFGASYWTANSGYHNDVIGIGRDDPQELEQNQSQTPDDSTRIYLNTLQTSNVANVAIGSFGSNHSYIMMGNNKGAMYSTTASNAEVPTGLTSCTLQSRLEREWKVTRTSSSQAFSIDITLNSATALTSVNPTALRLLIDDDGDFSAGTTTCYYNGDGTGIVITYNNPVITISGISSTQIANNSSSYITLAAMCTAEAASSTPTLCINTALTNITHTTTGATSIANDGIAGANGLPAGVSASWSGNTIIISGTPATSGTFNYSILLDCGAVSATGTIVVNAEVIPTFTQLGPYCVDDTPGTLPTTSNNGATGTWNTTISTANNGTITYTFTPSSGCFTTATMDVSTAVQPGGLCNGLVLWLKADEGVTGASPVTDWDDQSGFNNHTTANSTPQLVVSGINYNPAIDFDGSNDYFETSTTDILLGSQAYTKFAVVVRAAGSGSGVVIAGSDANSHNLKVSNSRYVKLKHSTDLETSTNQIQNDIPSMIAARYGATETVVTRLDGNEDSPGTPTEVFTDGKTQIGCRENGTQDWTGYVAETIEYSSVLTDTEIDKVETYLAIKYGLTIDNSVGGTAGDYISTTGNTIWDASVEPSYHNNVIGIGREDSENLHQKQSHSIDDTTIIYDGSFQASNVLNTQGISTDYSYTIIGDNQGAMHYTAASIAEMPAGCSLHSRLEREWKVTKTSNFDIFKMKITLSAGALPTSVNIADLRFLVDDDGDFSNGGTTCYSHGGGVNFTYNDPVITITGIGDAEIPDNSTRYITIGSVSISTPLPVELINFDANCADNNVTLNWSTASETNNDYFTIERSTDAINFEAIATINGSGNSSITNNYSWTDDNPLYNTSYYRLKQTDFNGAFEYHGVKAISCEQSTNIGIYPNPFENSFTVQLSGNATYPITVEILDYMGRAVHTQVIESATTQIALDELAKGTYFVKVFNDEIHIVERIVKTN